MWADRMCDVQAKIKKLKTEMYISKQEDVCFW